LKINGGSENVFRNCTIGVDTVKRTAANSVLLFDGSSSRNQFIECRIVSWAETNTYVIVKIADNAGCGRYTIFDRCHFYNFWANHADKLNEVFDIPATTATFDVILKDCLVTGADEWDAGDSDGLWVHNLGGAATSGIALAPAL